MSTIGFFTTLGVLTSIAATVFLVIFVVGDKRRMNLGPFEKVGDIIRDLYNFKTLYIETFVRITYLLCTVMCVVVGIFMLFGFDFSRYGIGWTGGYGILLAVFGPIVVRIAYEVTIMGILLVRNVIQINNKLKDKE